MKSRLVNKKEKDFIIQCLYVNNPHKKHSKLCVRTQAQLEEGFHVKSAQSHQSMIFFSITANGPTPTPDLTSDKIKMRRFTITPRKERGQQKTNKKLTRRGKLSPIELGLPVSTPFT